MVEEIQNEKEKLLSQQQKQQRSELSGLFDRLRIETIEYSSGEVLRLQDSECVSCEVEVAYDPADPTKSTPKHVLVSDYNDKDKKKMRLCLDIRIGNTKKKHIVSELKKREVLAMLERGVRRMKICRSGIDRETRYTYEALS
jgi:hypothetical protein